MSENVSSSEAQVSNITGDELPLDVGAANSVNSRQMKASEFSVVPSTAPALAGTATTTVPCAQAVLDPSKPDIRAEMIVKLALAWGTPSNGLAFLERS